MTAQGGEAASQLLRLFDDLLVHDGWGDLRIELRPLKRGQKEVLLSCGKQYRYVVDVEPLAPRSPRTSPGAGSPDSPDAAKSQLVQLLQDLVLHDGFSDMSVEVRILKRSQKEVLIRCGKQYRYVIEVETVVALTP